MIRRPGKKKKEKVKREKRTRNIKVQSLRLFTYVDVSA
jgi:hypothetical protein